MAASMKSLGIDQWSREEQWQLFSELFDTLYTDPTEFLTPAQQDELKECLEDHRRNPNEGQPWREVMAELEAEG
ncbi:MAG TPA: addiction module protein [Planctomycetaceae bacterium]|jgi:putative addiction module component (TIGR02574 family)|nr:addiction module protein [Planctomycetaceae bacterium]